MIGRQESKSQFQSTPPHRRRRSPLPLSGQPLPVSIHAPAQEATCICGVNTWRSHVSIHAPAQEATGSGTPTPRTPSRFNPRPRTGGDWAEAIKAATPPEFQSTPPHRRRPMMDRSSVLRYSVSIHAPAQEATRSACRAHGVCEFQSTPPHRRRQGLLPKVHVLDQFQSTPPHRRRRRPMTGHRGANWFQSTPPHRRRPHHVLARPEAHEFQSTPPHRRRPTE